MTMEGNGVPMIEVNDLVKEYGRHVAVNGVSFKVARGEIVGVVGPNGAGKSTTLRILAGFLAATEGTARVAGHDVTGDSIEGRQRVGYMPESNPLPEDMRVREYLKFRARLKGLDKDSSRMRVDQVIEQFGLEGVHGRLIGHLSKGYRQRVGLADALVHEPDLIILDEPTIGLDPHQILGVREHIKRLATDHTVLISSHILAEMEVTCSRLMIFHRGRLIAADTQANLQRRVGGQERVVVELEAPEDELNSTWEEMAEVMQHRVHSGEGAWQRSVLTPRRGVDLRPQLARLARERNWPLRELTHARPSLEDIFMQLTRPDDEEDLT